MSIKQRRALMFVAVTATLALGLLALVSATPDAGAGREAGGQRNPNRPQAEFLPVTLRLGGFVPRELSRPAGEYLLSINDLSGLSEVDLRLERENGEKVHEVKLLRRKPYWRQQVRLTPGTYLLSEANHPGWVCRITVTAH